MKYCAKCGTQMSDDTVVCPQCKHPANSQHSQILSKNSLSIPKKSLEKKSDRTFPLIIVDIVLTSLVLIALVIMYFLPPANSSSTNDSNSSISNSITSNDSNSACPANEYGNHDWSRATCQKPSYCFDCKKEKNGELGNHSWNTDEDGNRYCWDCGIPYDDYVSSES